MSIEEGLSQASLIHVLRVDSGIGSETPCGLLDDMVLTKHRQSYTWLCIKYYATVIKIEGLMENNFEW